MALLKESSEEDKEANTYLFLGIVNMRKLGIGGHKGI